MRYVQLVAFTLSLAVLPRPALACSCVPFTKAQVVERASLIFTGTATNVGRAPFGITCSSADPVAVSFDVETVYKGDARHSISVRTVASGVSCGYEFVAGQRYTVFVRDGETGLCGGNVEGTIVPSEYGLPAGRAPQR